jgi:Polyketide cyclase / dehydrase and lipid transport
MTMIRVDIDIEASPDFVWDVLRDTGAVHTRLAPGFVTSTRLEGDSRHVTFANGVTVRELLVSCDDAARRLAYSVQGGTAQHHHASFEAKPNERGGTRLVWTTDVYPDAAAATVRPMIEQGTEVMRRTLGRAQAPRQEQG